MINVYLIHLLNFIIVHYFFTTFIYYFLNSVMLINYPALPSQTFHKSDPFLETSPRPPVPGAEEILAEGSGPPLHQKYSLMQGDATPRKSFVNQLTSNGRSLPTSYTGGLHKKYEFNIWGENLFPTCGKLINIEYYISYPKMFYRSSQWF